MQKSYVNEPEPGEFDPPKPVAPRPMKRNASGVAFTGKRTGGWHGSKRAVRWYADEYDFAYESNHRMTGYQLWLKGELVKRTFRSERTAIAYAIKHM